MRVGFDTKIDIALKARPTAGQAGILHVLGEFPNRFVSKNDLCERLGVDVNAMKIQMCRLRKLLPVEWTIESRRNDSDGYRLIDMRGK